MTEITETLTVERLDTLLATFPGAWTFANAKAVVALAREGLAGRAEIERLRVTNEGLREIQMLAEAKLAAALETWTDEHGTTWTPPTAWAYAQACRVMHEAKARADAAEARVRGLEEALRSSIILMERAVVDEDHRNALTTEPPRTVALKRLRKARAALQPASEPSAPEETPHD